MLLMPFDPFFRPMPFGCFCDPRCMEFLKPFWIFFKTFFRMTRQVGTPFFEFKVFDRIIPCVPIFVVNVEPFWNIPFEVSPNNPVHSCDPSREIPLFWVQSEYRSVKLLLRIPVIPDCTSEIAFHPDSLSIL